MIFSVYSIVVGGYLAFLKLRAINKKLPLSLKDKISFGEGLILMVSGITALCQESVIPINAIILAYIIHSA